MTASEMDGGVCMVRVNLRVASEGDLSYTLIITIGTITIVSYHSKWPV